MAEQRTELLIIGGGPGGYAAAFMAADLGHSVTIIDEQENPGGVCLYRGCIPTKALLNSVKHLHDGRRAEQFGISFGEPKIDLKQIRRSIDGVVQKLTKGVGGLAKKRGVAFIQGRASFTASNTVEIDPYSDSDQKATRLEFEKAIIATGSHPVELPNISFQSEYVWSSADALEMREIPERMLVIGAGYIGLELGYAYASLGSKVTVADIMPEIMPGADRDVISIFKKANSGLFEGFFTETSAAEITEGKNGVTVRFEGDGAPEDPVEYDRILLTVGRKPNMEEMGLENTKVEFSEKGFLQVDKQFRTADPSIFAIGDVIGAPLLAHKASHEGRIAAEVFHGKNVAFDNRVIPSVEYTEPEIAWAGLSENEAESQGRKVSVLTFPWAASGRAVTLGATTGLTKLIVDPESERILGGAIVGSQAGELIGEIALAIEMGATAEDLALTIHPHPTLSETIMEAGETLFGTSTHIYRPLKS
ncbi:MAG: dihydrolipoyl dehydrogenase [Spirochaeta sp.]